MRESQISNSWSYCRYVKQNQSCGSQNLLAPHHVSLKDSTLFYIRDNTRFILWVKSDRWCVILNSQ
jgi:hypothetical protein